MRRWLLPTFLAVVMLPWIAAPAAGQNVNLAQGKTATQSSTGFDGPASRAVDGNTDGNYYALSVSHTNAEAQPWWQVDLGAVYSVTSVQIWNRTDCCSARTANLDVRLSDDGQNWRDTPFPGAIGSQSTIPVSGTARYVRIQLRGTEYLHLAEVQVWGSPTPQTPPAAAAPPTQGCAAPPAGMIAWWPADGNANDIAGSSHATPQNGATYAPGRVGQAFSFDGVDDYLDVGNQLNMSASDFTIETWIRGDPTMESFGRIVDKGYATGYALGSAGGNVIFEFLGGNRLTTPINVVDNQWHHIAVVKSGSTADIFADGTKGTPIPAGGSQSNSLPLWIGFNPGEGTQGHWKGQIDELAMFNRALSASEVQGIVNAGAAGKCRPGGLAPPPSGPAAPVPVPPAAAPPGARVLGPLDANLYCQAFEYEFEIFELEFEVYPYDVALVFDGIWYCATLDLFGFGIDIYSDPISLDAACAWLYQTDAATALATSIAPPVLSCVVAAAPDVAGQTAPPPTVAVQTAPPPTVAVQAAPPTAVATSTPRPSAPTLTPTSVTAAPSLGTQWQVCEGVSSGTPPNCIPGTWTRQGTGNTWSAVWGSVAATLTITQSGRNVTVERRDTTSTLRATYRGEISTDNTRVAGTVDWCCDGMGNRSGYWSATILGR